MLSHPLFGRNFLRNKSFYSKKPPRKTTIPSSSSRIELKCHRHIDIGTLLHPVPQGQSTTLETNFSPGMHRLVCTKSRPQISFWTYRMYAIVLAMERPTSFPVPSARQGPRQMALVQTELLCTAIGQCNRISIMICDWITGVCFAQN